MADNINTSISSTPNIYQHTGIVATDNGWLFFGTNVSGVTNELKIWRSTDDGVSWVVYYVITGITYNYNQIAMASRGNKIVVVYTHGYQMQAVSIDVSIVSTSTFGIHAPPSGAAKWALVDNFNNSDLIIHCVYIGSDNKLYFYLNYYDGSSSYNFMNHCPMGGGNGQSVISSGGGGTSIVEFNGYVYWVSNMANRAYRSPIGGNNAIETVNILNTLMGLYPVFVVHPTNGYLYLFSYNNNPLYYFSIARSSDGTTWQFWNGTAWVSSGQISYTIPSNIVVQSAQVNESGLITLLCTDTSATLRVVGIPITISGESVTKGSEYTLHTYTEARRSQNYSSQTANPLARKRLVSVMKSGDTNDHMTTFVRTYNTAPNAPNLISPGNGSVINDTTPLFAWNFSDPDAGNTQSAWQIQVSTDSTFSVVNGFDTGKTPNNWQSWDSTAPPLGNNLWYYRIRTWDNSDVVSPWSWSPSFRIDTVAPTIGGITGTTYTKTATQRMTITGVADTYGIQRVDAYILNKAGTVWSGPFVATNAGGGSWYYDFNASYEGEGSHTVRFWVYDTAQNGSFRDSVIVYDTLSPAAPTQTNGVLYATSNGASWTAFSDGASSSGLLLTTMNLQTWNGSAWVNVATYPKSVTGITHSFTGLTPATQYRWGVTYTDNSSNVSTLNYTTFTTNTYSVTTTVNLASVGSILNQKPKIKFTATDANDATLTNFQIQISTVNTFASTVLDTTSSAVATGWGATSLASGGTNSYIPQANLPAGTLYVRMRAYDGKDWGLWSATVTMIIKAINWPTTISDADTAISKRTIDDIRTEVNNVRQARGLAVAAWTDSTIKDWNDPARTNVRMGHLTELRQAIVDVYAALSITAPTWTDNIISTSTPRKGKHWSELRTYLAAC